MDAKDRVPIVIGADPGFGGGIVALTLDGKFVAATAMPTIKVAGGNDLDVAGICAFLARASKGRDVHLVAIEKVHAMPRDSKSGAFRFGFYYGKLCCAVEVAMLPLELVTPQAWQKVVLAGTKAKGKQDAIAYARKRFPTMSLKRTPKCENDHDGIADAACIAEWARRRITGRGQNDE